MPRSIIFYETIPDGPAVASPDVSTLDGFLETSHGLRKIGSNMCAENQIRDVAKTPSLVYRQKEGHEMLSRRHEKREQTRSFVRIMGWATDVEDETIGLGFSDKAMDWNGGCIHTCGAELAGATGLHSTFMRALAADILPLEGQCIEQIRWAGRHWVRAGRPALNSVEVLIAMKEAGLLPERKYDNLSVRVQKAREKLRNITMQAQKRREELKNISFLLGHDSDSE